MASEHLASSIPAKQPYRCHLRRILVWLCMASYLLVSVQAKAQEFLGYNGPDSQSECDAAEAAELFEYQALQGDGFAENTQTPALGYSDGFVFASPDFDSIPRENYPFSTRLNGWMQLRHAAFDSDGPNRSRNTLSLERIRIGLDGHAFVPELRYTMVVDANSDQAADVNFLDAFLSYDIGSHALDMRPNSLGLRAGKWKSPFSRSREESARRFQFTERSVANLFFDVGRSTGFAIYGEDEIDRMPARFEVAVINGINSGRDATISADDLDRNFAFSGRTSIDPLGPFTVGESDLEWSPKSILRLGAGFVGTRLDREGKVEFARPRVVASGQSLAELLPMSVNSFDYLMFTLDAHWKVRGFSLIAEHHWRTLYNFSNGSVPTLNDAGLLLQAGYFLVPKKYEALVRWSNIVGDSGTLGRFSESTNEIGTGLVRHFHGHDVKFTVDLSWIDGVPINSPRLSLLPGDEGLLLRSQLQFGF